MGSPCYVHLASLAVVLTLVLATIQGIHGIQFKVINKVKETEEGKYFDSLIGEKKARRIMRAAANFIFENFKQPFRYDRKYLKKIVLIINNTDKASAYGIRESVGAIWISAMHIKDYEYESAAREIFNVLLYFEMTHILQWTSESVPPVLMDGIAAFMVLKVGYELGGTAERGDGQRWNANYEVTARFLEYCQLFYSQDFIAALNQKLKVSYSDDIFEDILGQTLEQLWAAYKAKYAHQHA